MKSSLTLLLFLLLLLFLVLPGCLLKPTTVKTHSYILTPISSSSSSSIQGSPHLPIGVGLVKMPDYLLRTSMAVRKSGNEIDYLETSLWAERLDLSFQRALAANLATLVPTDEIRLSAWRSKEVALALYVNVDQFDVNAEGRGTLVAWWRITTPAGDKVLKSGETTLHRNGPAPQADAQALATTLSELTADFCKTLAQTIRELATP
jgi:uncharacterized lipoprotein YmbA